MEEKYLSKSEVEDVAEEAAERGAKKVLLALGVDVNNPIDTQQDMAYLRKSREGYENTGKYITRTAIGIFVVGLCWALWEGFKHYVHL